MWYSYYKIIFVVFLLLMAKKETRKEQDDRELKFLTENQLTDTELTAIRKLNGATKVPGRSESSRTIEAVLQGRRTNARILQAAIKSAMERLNHYTEVMNGLLNKLKG